MLSIVIPTKNGAATLPALLDALERQEVDDPTELVIVDSGSSDGTLEMARERADRCLTVAPDAFDHGLTRNHAIEAAHGDLVVLLVQDAVPASTRLLHELAEPLRRDPAVAGSFARQVPRPDASAITRHYLDRWVAASPEGHVTEIDVETFARLTPAERLARSAFDNVCSCLRREVWRAIPFRSSLIAEDLAWAKEVLLAGHRLVYTPEAAVVHSHDRSAAYELARTRLVHRQLAELFGLRTIPTAAALARAIAATTALHLRLAFPHPMELARGLALAVAWPLGQYLGGRDFAADVQKDAAAGGLS